MSRKTRYMPPTDLSGIVAREITPPPISDISVQRLIDDGLIALYREIKNILSLSARGKLDPNHARDLRDHLKLLFELKDREKEALAGLTDEQLQAKLEDASKPKPSEDTTDGDD